MTLVFDEDMMAFPLEWDDPPHWIQWINDKFNECDYHVHSNNFETWFNKVQCDLHSWVIAGSWLYKARRLRAYCHHYDNWQQFCQKALNLSQFQVNNYIKSARVFLDLASTGFKILPSNVSQCLPLSKLRDFDLTEAWQKVIDENPPHRITQKAIEATLTGEPVQAKKRLEVPKTEWEQFQERCLQAGLDPKDELKRVLGGYDPETGEIDPPEDLKDDEVEVVDPEKLEAWRHDMNDLLDGRNATYNMAFFVSDMIEDFVDILREVFTPPPE